MTLTGPDSPSHPAAPQAAFSQTPLIKGPLRARGRPALVAGVQRKPRGDGPPTTGQEAAGPGRMERQCVHGPWNCSEPQPHCVRRPYSSDRAVLASNTPWIGRELNRTCGNALESLVLSEGVRPTFSHYKCPFFCEARQHASLRCQVETGTIYARHSCRESE